MYENILGIFTFKSLREPAACAPNKKQFALQPMACITQMKPEPR